MGIRDILTGIRSRVGAADAPREAKTEAKAPLATGRRAVGDAPPKAEPAPAQSASQSEFFEIERRRPRSMTRTDRDGVHKDVWRETKAVPTCAEGHGPFKPREYVCLEHRRIVRETGQVTREDRTFYADAEAARETLRWVRELEGIIAFEAAELRAVPPLRMDEDGLRGAEECKDRKCYPGVPTLRETPPTPTGRKPKYPFSIGASTLARDRSSQSAGIWFLPDGSVGKAGMCYSMSDGVKYSVSLRVKDGKLTVTSLTRTTWDGNDGTCDRYI